MAGLYIHNVKLPESAFDTLYLAVHQDGTVEYDGGPYGWQNTRAIPVQDHGRLVDADDVVEQIDKWIDSVGYATVGRGLSYYGELLGCIDDSPTVIPASKEEA